MSYVQREVPFSKTESAANTFTELEIDLADTFSPAELERGIRMYDAIIDLEYLGSAAAINTEVGLMAQVTSQSKSAEAFMNSKTLLAKLSLRGYAGANVANVDVQTRFKFPEDGEPVPEFRSPTFDNQRSKAYVGVQGDGLAAARTVYGTLVFLVPL